MASDRKEYTVEVTWHEVRRIRVVAESATAAREAANNEGLGDWPMIDGRTTMGRVRLAEPCDHAFGWSYSGGQRCDRCGISRGRP